MLKIAIANRDTNTEISNCNVNLPKKKLCSRLAYQYYEYKILDEVSCDSLMDSKLISQAINNCSELESHWVFHKYELVL